MIFSSQCSKSTVRPLLSGYPWDFENWPPNRGWPLNRGIEYRTLLKKIIIQDFGKWPLNRGPTVISF